VHGQNSKGFTLIELMVVIGVLAILSAVAMPSYRELMDNYRVRQAGEDVISLISSARTGSVKLHRQVNVSFTTGTNWCAGANAAVEPTGGALAGAAAACDCANPSTCVLGTSGTERAAIPAGKHPGVTMATATNALVFNGVSGVTTGLTGTTVTLTSPMNKFTATVTVTPLGQSNLVVTGNN
jgi:type IV fimbrial biogenesis protein FimT